MFKTSDDQPAVLDEEVLDAVVGGGRARREGGGGDDLDVPDTILWDLDGGDVV